MPPAQDPDLPFQLLTIRMQESILFLKPFNITSGYLLSNKAFYFIV